MPERSSWLNHGERGAALRIAWMLRAGMLP